MCASLISLQLEAAMWQSSHQWDVCQGLSTALLSLFFLPWMEVWCREMCCHSGSSATINEWKPRTTETSSWWRRPWQPALLCFKFKLQLFYYLTHWLPITNEFNIWVAILWLSFKNLSDEIKVGLTPYPTLGKEEVFLWIISFHNTVW